jgi:sugar phosphate isomerase/epimerase
MTEAPPVPALSTMWAVQPRFQRDLRGFMEKAAELGFEAIEINHSMDAEAVGAILGHRVLPVTSVHAPAPLERHPRHGWNRELNLASRDEEERALAVSYTRLSIELAEQAGARAVVVHLGHIGERLLNSESRLRRMYDARHVQPVAWDALIDETVRERASLAAPYLEQARRSLAELVEHAEPRGVALGLECRLGYHEIPSPREARELLAPYPTSVAGYWHDVGHAEVQHRLGLTVLDAWFEEAGDRLIGVHIHDVRGLTDHRAPGKGDVDFRRLAPRLPATALRTFEIDQHEPDEDVRAALELARGAAVVG